MWRKHTLGQALSKVIITFHPYEVTRAQPSHLPGYRTLVTHSQLGVQLESKCIPWYFYNYLQPSSCLFLFFSSSVTYKSNLPSCYSGPGIWGELFQTFTMAHGIIPSDENPQPALIAIFQSESSTHLWFSAITQDKISLLLWIKNLGKDKWQDMETRVIYPGSSRRKLCISSAVGRTSSLSVLAPDSGKRPQNHGSSRINAAGRSCSLQRRGKHNTVTSTAWNLHCEEK